MKVIIYDENNLDLKTGIVANFGIREPLMLEVTDLGDIHRKFIPDRSICLSDLEIQLQDKIELDPTTMKKILMYNKEAEFKEINEKIQEAQAKLKKEEHALELYKEKMTSAVDAIKEYLESDVSNFQEWLEEKYEPSDDW